MIETILFYWGFIFIGAALWLGITNRIKIVKLKQELFEYSKYIDKNYKKKNNEVDKCFHFEDDMF